MTYFVRLRNGDTAEAETVPEIIEAALTIAREAGCFLVDEARLADTHCKPLTAVIRWAVLEAKPGPYDWARSTLTVVK
jgi:hypothetical protein